MILESCISCYEQLVNCGASVFTVPPPPQAIARRPCRRSHLHPRACRGAQRLQGEANAALAEGREDGGEGAEDEGISFGIAYDSSGNFHTFGYDIPQEGESFTGFKVLLREDLYRNIFSCFEQHVEGHADKLSPKPKVFFVYYY